MRMCLQTRGGTYAGAKGTEIAISISYESGISAGNGRGREDGMLKLSMTAYKSNSPSSGQQVTPQLFYGAAHRDIFPLSFAGVAAFNGLKMLFALFELAFILPFCLGRVSENASAQEIEEKGVFSKDGTKRALLPSLGIRNGPAKMLEVMAGDAKYLECEAGGSPPPSIHWLKNGKKIAQSFYEAIHAGENEDETVPSTLGLGFTRSRLYIDCASSKDSGKYTCVAENEYLRDSKSGQIFVVDALDRENSAICVAKKTFGSPARVHMWTRTRLEMMGTDVQLFCRADGNPQPQVVWRGPGGAPLTNSRRYQVQDNGDLIIRNIVWSDMGGYTCRVSNSEGSDEILVFLYPTLPDNEKATKA